MQINQLQLDYKPLQLTLPVDYNYIIESNDLVVSFLEVVGGIHSLRKLEKACRTDIRFIYLANDYKPSHMVFQRFIDKKLTVSIQDIMMAINKHLIEKENINTDVMYIDGTKLEANATKFSFVWKKSVLNYRNKLYEKISKEIEVIKETLSLDYEIQEEYDFSDLEVTIKDIKALIEYSEIEFVHGKGSRKTFEQRHYESFRDYSIKLEEYKEHLEICGDRGSYSKTDHDATFMHGKEDYYNKTGIFKPYYNLQIGVCDEYIIHSGVFQNPGDSKTWIPFFETYIKPYGVLPTYPVADAGYGSYDNYMFNLENNYSLEKEKKFKKKIFNIKNMIIHDNYIESIDGDIFEYHHDYTKYGGRYPQYKKVYSYNGNKEGVPKSISRDIKLLDLQKEAKDNLDSELGITLKVKRSIQVEGAFGEIKHNYEYTRIHRRSKEKVETELSLIILSYNLRKYHNKKHRVKLVN